MRTLAFKWSTRILYFSLVALLCCVCIVLKLVYIETYIYHHLKLQCTQYDFLYRVNKAFQFGTCKRMPSMSLWNIRAKILSHIGDECKKNWVNLWNKIFSSILYKYLILYIHTLWMRWIFILKILPLFTLAVPSLPAIPQYIILCIANLPDRFVWTCEVYICIYLTPYMYLTYTPTYIYKLVCSVRLAQKS